MEVNVTLEVVLVVLFLSVVVHEQLIDTLAVSRVGGRMVGWHGGRMVGWIGGESVIIFKSGRGVVRREWFNLCLHTGVTQFRVRVFVEIIFDVIRVKIREVSGSFSVVILLGT